MKRFIPILFAVATAGLFPISGLSQELYPAQSTSQIERARADSDDAHRREADLSARITEQEKANATLRDQLRKLENDPASLQRDLVDVSDQAAALRKKFSSQRVRRDEAEDRLNAARGKALERYEQTEAMRAARNAVNDSAAELDRLSQPMLDQLAQDPAYQEATALVEAAAQAGEALQAFGEIDPKAQADADVAFDQAMASVRAMEDAAIDADPKAAEAHKTLRIAQDVLDGQRSANEKKIATDPGVDAARFALELEQKLFDDTSAELSTAEKRLSALRQATQPGEGASAEMVKQLKDGEGRLRDLNDQLEQAHVARQDTDARLRDAEGAIAGVRPSGEPYRPADPGAPYEPPYPDDGGYYDSGGYGYSYPAYGYGGYSVYSYAPYSVYRARLYDPFYCPPPFYGAGLFFSTGYYSRSHYRPYYAYGYEHRFHDDSWRRRYDYWRGRDSGVRDGRLADGRATVGSRRYDYGRFDRSEVGRDRGARSSLDSARQASSASERDYRFRTGVNTYNYPGSTALRLRQYEQDARERRSASASASDAGRSASEERDRSGASVRSERSVSSGDSAARLSRAEEAARESRSSADSARPRTEWRPRTSENESRGTRANDDVRRSRASDDSAPSRTRGSDVSSSRSRGEAPAAAPSRDSGSSSRGRGSASSPPPPPPPSSSGGSSRGSSRGGGSPPPSFGSPRSSSPAPSAPSGGGGGGSFRGGESAAPSGGGGGSSRGSSGSSSSSGRSSSGGGGSSSSGRR